MPRPTIRSSQPDSRRHYPEAGEAYLRVRTINDPALLAQAFFGEALVPA